MTESNIAERSWFGTLTLTPERQQYALDVARRAEARQGCDFDALSVEEQFRKRHAVVSAEITRWLKRVRKNSGAPLRYFLVVEAHKSGAPHYHVIVHESDPARPVRHAVLKKAWTWGFSRFNLLHDKRAAAYATKYLAKSSLARVRASERYGTGGTTEPTKDPLTRMFEEQETTPKKNSSF